MTTYNLKDQLIKGEEQSSILDKCFSPFYHIYKAPTELERLGVDRIFISKDTRKQASVEYKVDFITASTKNVFVETVSVKEKDVPGWALTSIAQILVYYVPDWNVAYFIDMLKVKQMVETYIEEYGIKSVKNEGWTAEGVPVPIDKFMECAISELEVKR